MIIVLGKGGRLLRNLTLFYNDIELDIVNQALTLVLYLPQVVLLAQLKVH